VTVAGGGSRDAGGGRPPHPVRTWLTAYGIAAVVFAVLDVIWLGTIAQRLYQEQLGHLLAEEFNLVPAAAFYLLYLVGLVHFALRPLESGRGLGVTLRDAALYGLMTYMTWDLTSAAVFRDFPTLVIFVDIAWGVGASTAVAALTWWLTSRRRSPSPAA